jgi:superfamily II DNA helicase RecQ
MDTNEIKLTITEKRKLKKEKKETDEYYRHFIKIDRQEKKILKKKNKLIKKIEEKDQRVPLLVSNNTGKEELEDDSENDWEIEVMQKVEENKVLRKSEENENTKQKEPSLLYEWWHRFF